ncbi:hypothetical protein M405DRAFT_832338 [Rhizopogon salebrosus TDB-379]|nr:hypothetical protein M405DRAFT_832338 [Rhizopogon salebrosus TDB-379]
MGSSRHLLHATGSCYLLFLGCGTLLNIPPQATIALRRSSIVTTLQSAFCRTFTINPYLLLPHYIIKLLLLLTSFSTTRSCTHAPPITVVSCNH